MVSHGHKLNKFGVPNMHIEIAVLNFGLLLLWNISYKMTYKVLISTFVERWYQNTNIFHLLVGEMTMTLDFVSTLLRISSWDNFFLMWHWISLHLNPKSSTVLVELLGIDLGDVMVVLVKYKFYIFNCISEI